MIMLASKQDLFQIKKFIDEIRKELLSSGNPQWQEDYPNDEIILDDINNKYLYLYKENNILKAIVSITEDLGEYTNLVKNTTSKTSYVIHRLAVKKEYRQENIAYNLLKFAEDLAKKNNIKVLKSDTEISNIKMINLFKKLGFKYMGSFSYEDYPGNYEYFEKLI